MASNAASTGAAFVAALDADAHSASTAVDMRQSGLDAGGNKFKQASIMELQAVLQRTVRPNIILLGSVISTQERSTLWEASLETLCGLLPQSMRPCTIAYNTAVSACEKGGHWQLAASLIQDLQQKALQVDTITQNIWISACGKRGSWDMALGYFDHLQMEGSQPDAFTYNAAMSACERSRKWEIAISVLGAVEIRKLPPDVVAFHTSMGACAGADRWEEACALLATMEQISLEPDNVAYGTVTSTCERCRAVAAGVRLAARLAMPHITQTRKLPQPGLGLSVNLQSVSSRFKHKSVLLGETVEAFVAVGLAPGAVIIDCTLGGAGHSEAILDYLPESRLLGIDRDLTALKAAEQRLQRFGRDRVQLVHGDFGDAPALLAKSCFASTGGLSPLRVGGILADLGVSSPQLDLPARGFSFRTDGPLDMRMDLSNPTLKPATWYLANMQLAELAHSLAELGEEHHARLIAKRLNQAQPQTTLEAARIVEKCYPSEANRRVHPATKTFQALRILVNGELDSLTRLLRASPDLLSVGGLLCIISFHSLEDRLVRQRMLSDGKQATNAERGSLFISAGGREGVRPSAEEVAWNPRSRSARLRAAVRRSATARFTMMLQPAAFVGRKWR